MARRALLLGPLMMVIFMGWLAVGEEREVKKVGWIQPVVQEIEGWTVHVDPVLLPGGSNAEEGEKALKMLANHLQRISILLPSARLAEMKKLEIWVENEHPELVPMQYHPGSGWLMDRGYDPRLAKKVHVTQARALLSREQLLKHPAVILHELAHAYHDQILGFDDARVIEAYQAAMKAGILAKVKNFRGEMVEHYAATNEKEYFAEATEAYLYRNDFYPFVAAELKEHDPKGFALMLEIWGPAAVGK